MTTSPRHPDTLRALAGQLTPAADSVARLADAWLEPGLTELGISLAQFRVIGAMLGPHDGMTQRELARRLGLDPTTVSVALKKLEARGYIERTVDDADARARRVRPAAEINEFAGVMQLLATLDTIACAGISADALQITRETLHRVAANLRHALAATSGETT